MGSEPLTTHFELVDCQVQIPKNLRLQMLPLKYQGRRTCYFHVWKFGASGPGQKENLERIRGRRYWSRELSVSKCTV